MVRHVVERRQWGRRSWEYAGRGRCGRSGHGERLLLDQVRVQLGVSVAATAIMVMVMSTVEELLLVMMVG